MTVSNNKLKIIDNRYITVSKKGDGGFATVYKAWARNLERFVAIKEIHEELSRDAKFLDMFRDEAVNTAQLTHENIVQVIDFLKDIRNVYYIVMEYVKGRDLASILEKCNKLGKGIPQELAIYVVLEILKALEYAHSKKDDVTGVPLNVVHRDISPSNVMLYYDGRIKLTDFGIAKATSSHIEKTQGRVLKGKLSYMSPEQAEGNYELDNRSDLFSVGVVLYELITGKKPFYGETDLDVWMRVKKARIDQKPLNGSSSLDIPEELKNIILKALEKDLDKRYQSSSEMIKDLKNYLKDGGEGLKQNLITWLAETLEEEIINEEEAIREEMGLVKNISSKIDKFTPTHEEPSPISQPVQEETEEPVEGKKDKTVFDFVLDTARRYKRTLMLVGLFLLIGGFVFEGFDIFQRWTKLGVSINNRIWPPALTIETIPKGAKLTLKQGDRILLTSGENVTPLNIKKILPGNYLLILEKDGYKKIERKISVVKDMQKKKENIYFSEGKVIADQDEQKKNFYTIPFEVELNIDSIPLGACVYIDGKKIPGITPLKTVVEVGEHSVKLTYEGFEPLGNIDKAETYGQCNLNLLKSSEEQQGIDHRHWDFSYKLASSSPGYKMYHLEGILWKKASINSNPSGSKIYVDDEETPRATTPIHDLKLKAGLHKINLSMKGFQDWQSEVEVNAEEEIDLHPTMKKWIWFYSQEKGRKDKDIHASVYVKGTSIKGKKTPFKYALPTSIYHITFKKPPRYHNRFVKVNIDAHNSVRGVLKLQKPHLKIVVKDELTEKPVPQAYVFLNEKFEGRTDKKGIWKNSVEPGDYTIQINKGEQYASQEFEENLSLGERITLDVFLSYIKDASIIIDTRPLYKESEIYIDGDFVGRGFKKLEEITRSKHTITIKHPDLEEDLVEEIEFNEPEQVLILRLVEKEGRPVFELGTPIPQDATLVVDTRPHFIGAHIYLNGKYEGNTVRKISNLSRSKHTVLIEHRQLENAIEQIVEFQRSNDTIILKLDEYGDIYIR